ncbi:unnamed protein product [Hermetia illucens]|uniref:HECT domain-containing protein n=1 Tax=Hermetia illucens TaxID=343691 RepID=A0A7R8UJ75_HERIL|nr:probable E3 ubiquitin-protein ligase HERC4 isoform X4 [Hermetia illucens]CAD7081549.1 unnamed protein product [Hermetia illucens]
MAVYCWGNTSHGELGLGGIEDELILTPRKMTWSEAPGLIQAACGCNHTVLLTKAGKTFSCGCNDHGQLGHDLSRKRPQPIAGLENYVITQISCGIAHSLALNEWGQVFSWGSDSTGQLGLENGSLQPHPKIIKLLATKHIVQIASGHNHCLALSNNGQLFAWGLNSYGQLGIGSTSEKVMRPTEVKSLAGIPIAFIACGANHSFVISKSGAVFGWGKNSCGQLGLNDEQFRSYPTQLKTLRSLGVRYISCGDDFSVFLTVDGGVFTCGSGTYGQLGHGIASNEILPRMVLELMGSTITQISCGSRHTLALVASRGRVYGFGLGCSGQLGARNTNNSFIPQVVLGPWVSPNGTSLLNGEESPRDVSTMSIRRIFSGGDQCFVSTTEFSDNIPPDDCRVHDSKTQILCLTSEMTKACAEVPAEGSVDLDLLSNIELIFKSQACINGSCLLPNDEHYCCTSKHHGIDIAAAEEIFKNIRRIENESLKQIIWDGVTNDLMKTLVPSPADVETLRIYVILPLYHEFVNAKNYLRLHTPFCQAVFKLSAIPGKIVSEWWASLPAEFFEGLVTNYKSVVLYIINFNFAKKREDDKRILVYEPNLTLALNFLLYLHRINHLQRKDRVSYGIFYMPELMDFVDIQQDYVQWIMDKNPHTFHLCNYPFLFNAEAKTLLLQTDQAIQMQSAMQNAATQGLYYMFTGAPVAISQFVVLNVTRENLVQDTFREISHYGASDLKKPLKVKFHGEEAEDAGGVRKEFFMLLLKDILDPKYGMFKEFEDSRAIWFSDHSFESVEMYYLIGVICGLAIYNFTIIHLPFPLALYKKLLKEPVDLDDLIDLSPVLANSLKNILEYNGEDVQDVFGLNFEVTRDIFGESHVVELKPNGSEIPVTRDNRKEFVDLYIDFIFNKSVEKQFQAFHDGFMKVCGGRVLELFKPHELMAVVIGNEDYDWYALEAEAEYKNGYTSGDQTIRWFWEVFHELPLAEKKKFLLYLTGSDRIPIQGMKAIKITIQPTNDDKFLPVAHTCFNLLDLPRYKTKERLKYKVLQAIQQTHGFSLV